jgi:ribosomal protein S17E
MMNFKEFLNESNLRNSFTFDCLDCKKDVQEMKEYSYMVSDEVWKSTNLDSNAGLLCIKCLEKRLKRLLTSEDFPKNIPINRDTTRQSKRLISRIYGYTDRISPEDSKYYAITGTF